jgi:Lar family restriction alleviation protein|nr:MAG TPA: restriction alleviation protein [Caudoviricetes sp.]
MKSINSVLKSCPFCGGEAVLFVENGVQVMCLSCGVRTSLKVDKIYQKGVSQEKIATSSVEQVIEEWNRRV